MEIHADSTLQKHACCCTQNISKSTKILFEFINSNSTELATTVFCRFSCNDALDMGHTVGLLHVLYCQHRMSALEYIYAVWTYSNSLRSWLLYIGTISAIEINTNRHEQTQRHHATQWHCRVFGTDSTVCKNNHQSSYLKTNLVCTLVSYQNDLIGHSKRFQSNLNLNNLGRKVQFGVKMSANLHWYLFDKNLRFEMQLYIRWTACAWKDQNYVFIKKSIKKRHFTQ